MQTNTKLAPTPQGGPILCPVCLTPRGTAFDWRFGAPNTHTTREKP
jgi:hypothetical protein